MVYLIACPKMVYLVGVWQNGVFGWRRVWQNGVFGWSSGKMVYLVGVWQNGVFG